MHSLRTLTRILALCAFAAGFLSSCTSKETIATLPQCFRFDQPLGNSASGARERGDSTWYFVQLADSGIVRLALRPRREREAWITKNQWSASKDTLRIRVGDPLVGWDVLLWPQGKAFAGTATYLTDVIVAGWVPPRLNVHATKIKCPALPT